MEFSSFICSMISTIYWKKSTSENNLEKAAIYENNAVNFAIGVLIISSLDFLLKLYQGQLKVTITQWIGIIVVIFIIYNHFDSVL